MTIDELSRAMSPEAFAAGTPFSHVVLDGFLDRGLAEAVAREFPVPETMELHGGYGDARRRGFRANVSRLGDGPAGRTLLDFLRSPALRRCLAAMCRAETEVLSDPDYFGNALLLAEDQGTHYVHRDRNRHPRTHFYPRLVLLIYFNPDWKPGQGGEFQLWDRRRRHCTSIEPLFNRAIVFANGRRSYHGIGDVHLPPGMARKALNYYYYTASAGPAEAAMYIHGTEFFPRPGERLQYWSAACRTNFPRGLIEALRDKVPLAATTVQRLRRRSPSPDRPLDTYGEEELIPQPDQETIRRWREFNAGT